MANNFRIFQHRKGDSLHLKLSGDFDGSSALELLNLLKKGCNTCFNVVINTSELNQVHHFGQDVIKSHAGLFNQLNTRVHFIGKNIGLSPSMN